MATLTKNWQLLSETKMGSWGYGTLYLRLYGKYNSQNIANNSSDYTLEARVYCNGSYCYSGNCYAYLDGNTLQNNVSLTFPTNGELTLGTVGYGVTHNNSTGEYSNTVSAQFKCYGLGSTTFTTTATFSLPKIPRYATANQSLKSKTETTIVMNWSSDNTVDYVWHSLNNGSWVGHDVTDGKSGTYTITGLSAGTSYNVKTRIRRKDNQLTTDTSNISIQTYYYPHCTSSPNFTIGNDLTLQFYNPLGRSISVKGYAKNDNSEIFTGNTSGTSLTGFNDSTSVNNQYKSIPNSTFGYYKVEVTYNNHTETRDSGNRYSIRGNEIPNFTTAYYRDTNSIITGLTGNNQILVRYKSNAYVYIPSANKATSSYYTSISKYRITIGDSTQEVTYNSNNEVGVTIDKVTTGTISITAIDNRGLEKTIYINSNFKEYSYPSITKILVERQDGISTIGLLDLSVSYWNGNFGSIQNSIFSIAYQYRVKGGSYSSVITLDKNQFTVQNGVLSGNNILLPTTSNGTTPQEFVIGTQYEIVVIVTDQTYNTQEYTFSSTQTLSGGVPCTAKQKNDDGSYSIGINQLPESGAALSVKGGIKSFDESAPTVLVSNGTRKVELHIGSGGDNRGIYDREKDNWILYKDVNDNINLRGNNNNFIVGGNNDTYISPNGGNIAFRPKGVNDATNQAYINQDGILRIKSIFVAGGPLRQYAGDIKDFNQALTEGEYKIAGSGLTNYPNSSTDYGKLIVKVNDGTTHNNSDNWIWQYFMSTNSNIYYRHKVNDNNWTPWKKYNLQLDTLQEQTLYDNSSGTTGTVTLSDSVANYVYIEIFYFRNANASVWGSNFYKSQKIHYAGGKNACLDISIPPETNLTQVGSKIVNIGDKTITVKRETGTNIQESGNLVFEQSNIYIYRVIGYK